MKEYIYDIMAEQMKNKCITSRHNKERRIKEAEDIYSHLSEQLQRAVDLAREKGVSIYLGNCSSSHRTRLLPT